MPFFLSCTNQVTESKQTESSLNDETNLILPNYFDPINYPKDNLYDQKRAELGEQLFNDPRLSRDNTVSCASCHIKEYAFSDTVRFSTGIDGQIMTRNSPPLFNLFTHDAFFRDGGSPTLELQAIAPIESPEEMDMNIVELCDKLNQIETYRTAAKDLYNSDVTPFVISRSIGNYMRSLVSHHSRYDAYLQGETSALSEAEKKGFKLFNGKAQCVTCHDGADLRTNAYYNIGLYEDYVDSGLARITLHSSDAGRFKVPSLRNIAITAPYMHDGSMSSLREVINHFDAGGVNSSKKSDLIQALELTEQEKNDLEAFLRSLTDTTLSIE